MNQNGGDVSVPKWSTPIRGVVRHQEPNNPIFPGKFPNSWGHSSSKRIYHFFFAFHNSSPQHFSTKQPPTLGFSKKNRKNPTPTYPATFGSKSKRSNALPPGSLGFAAIGTSWLPELAPPWPRRPQPGDASELG